MINYSRNGVSTYGTGGPLHDSIHRFPLCES